MAVLDPLVALVAPLRRVNPARRRLLEVVAELVESRVRDGVVGEDLLGMLILARNETSTTEQLLDDTLTILLAGHDTISTALTWTWLLLDRHPEAAHRLSEEAAGVESETPFTFDDVQKLPYAGAVLSESLRLRPPAWILARRALETHDMLGTTIPEGALVLISPYLVHRDARFFRDPLAFRPERWLGDEMQDRPKMAFIPFGAGRRSCVGEAFAWMEGKIILTTVARQWRLDLTSAPAATDLRITMRPFGPVMMTPSARTRTA